MEPCLEALSLPPSPFYRVEVPPAHPKERKLVSTPASEKPG